MEDMIGSRSRKRLHVWMLLSLCFLSVTSFAFEEIHAEGAKEIGQTEIGTAVFVKRDISDVRTVYHTARSSFLIPERKHNIPKKAEKDSTAEAFLQIANTAGRASRALKYAGGCREDSNKISAIVECTNAVRNNPDLFARDYPCSYDQWRNEIGGRALGQLLTGSTIQLLAQKHTDDQARMNSMSHTGSDGSDLQTRADRISLPWGTVGENVAAGFSSAKAVVMAWMCSPAHRKNLMSCDFSTIGVGMGVAQNGRTYYTQVFSCGISEKCGCGNRPRSVPAAPAAPVPVPVAPRPRQHPPGIPAAPAAPHAPRGPTTTTTTVTHGYPPQDQAPQKHCDWVNGVWTCGKNIQPHQADPYNILAQAQAQAQG